MRILILGGTLFLGPHLVGALRARRHDVVLFNRGRTAAAPSDVPTIRGDRTVRADLQLLADERFDAIIDTSGYAPGDVRAAASMLRARTGRYVFISSISVYDLSDPPLRESSPRLTLPDGVPNDAYDERYYGAYKARCEDEARAIFGAQTLVVRPGLIVGPYDPTDRFSYWVERIARGGDVLAPGRPDSSTQFIDVRDLAAWIVAMVEGNVRGTYNATALPVALASVFETCRSVSGSDAVFHWVDEAFLQEHEVAPWIELPLWIPQTSPDRGLLHTDVSKAKRAGLTTRPLADTIRATLHWLTSRDSAHRWQAGPTRERERELLARRATMMPDRSDR